MKDMRREAAAQSVQVLIENIMQSVPQFAEDTDNADQYTDALLDALNQAIREAKTEEALSDLQEQVDEALDKLENIEYAIKTIRSTIQRKSEDVFDERFSNLS